MKNSNSKNFRLGIFVIIGITLFVLGVYFIGNRQNLFGQNSQIASVFKNVNGLQTGNNVRFAGVNVGTVKDIDIVNDTSIVVHMLINERTMGHIRTSTMATVSSDGLVGSMIVNLVPGDTLSPEKIEPGDTIPSISKIATADMLTTLNTTNENAALLTADLLKITNSINQGEGTLGALIRDEEMANQIKQSMVGLRKTTEAASGTVYQLNRILGSVDMEQSVAGILLNDSSAAGQLLSIIENLNESVREIDSMTINLKQFSHQLEEGDGVLNYIINDTTMVRHLEATLKNAEEASEKFDQNMEALQHNILFRGYFRKLERRKAREALKDDEN